MSRVTLTLQRPFRIRYRDSVHAALVTGLRAAGAEEAQVIGPHAAPWTFAIDARSFTGGVTLVRAITISTSDEKMGEVLLRLDPAAIRCRSSNGDVIDLSAAVLQPLMLPLAPDQDHVAVSFASPFLVSEQGSAKKTYARSTAGLDLSAAFSAGLSRRLGRPVYLHVAQDRLSAMTDGAAPILVRVRKSGLRDLILPALSAILTLRGSAQDVRDGYLAGLGEKTRYGFGCPMVLA